MRNLLGREYYARGGGQGYRNGYRGEAVEDWRGGEVRYTNPQVREVDGGLRGTSGALQNAAANSTPVSHPSPKAVASWNRSNARAGDRGG